jgi:hypothetical protein
VETVAERTGLEGQGPTRGAHLIGEPSALALQGSNGAVDLDVLGMAVLTQGL